MTKEIDSLESYKRNGYLTVKELKKALEGLPDDALVLSQRIEDIYFEKYNWDVVKKENHWTAQYKPQGDHYISEDVDALIENGEPIVEYSAEFFESLKDEFIPAWCTGKYEDDPNLYLFLHY